MATRSWADGLAGAWPEGPLVVEVRNRFDGSWSHGFEIVETVTDDPTGPRFRLRRLSDGSILPAMFTADDIVAYRPGAAPVSPVDGKQATAG